MENDAVEKKVKYNYDFLDNKAKNYYQANKEKIQKRLREYYRNLSNVEKIKKGIMVTMKIKI